MSQQIHEEIRAIQKHLAHSEVLLDAMRPTAKEQHWFLLAEAMCLSTVSMLKIVETLGAPEPGRQLKCGDHVEFFGEPGIGQVMRDEDQEVAFVRHEDGRYAWWRKSALRRIEFPKQDARLAEDLSEERRQELLSAGGKARNWQKQYEQGESVDAWLRRELAGGERFTTDWYFEHGKLLGYSKPQIERAAKRLGVKREFFGFHPKYELWWMPKEPASAAAAGENAARRTDEMLVEKLTDWAYKLVEVTYRDGAIEGTMIGLPTGICYDDHFGWLLSLRSPNLGEAGSTIPFKQILYWRPARRAEGQGANGAPVNLATGKAVAPKSPAD